MSNQNHLLLKTRDPNLSRALQWFGANYTCCFNCKHKRRGHLFQGRFKSLLVENDRYMLQLSCYIHRNPLRGGMVERLADYKWSSYLTYAFGSKTYAWTATEMILFQLQFKINTKHIKKLYRSIHKKRAIIWKISAVVWYLVRKSLRPP